MNNLSSHDSVSKSNITSLSKEQHVIINNNQNNIDNNININNNINTINKKSIIDSNDSNEQSEWEKSSFLKKWTFSVAVDMINEGQKNPLEFHQLLLVPNRDKASYMVSILQHHYKESKPFSILPKLMMALLSAHKFDVFLIGVFTVIENICMVASPVILRYLLLTLSPTYPIEQAYMWAAILSAIGFIQVFIHHVLFFHSMRLGWNWKNETTALIHEKILHLDAGILQSSGTSTGMLVNLISNDVARFEEFAVFGMSSWVSLLVIAAILVELTFILDIASAFAGVGCTIVLIPALIYSAKWFAKYRGLTAAATDVRVR